MIDRFELQALYMFESSMVMRAHLTAALAALTVLLSLTGQSYMQELPLAKLLVAHRGASAYAPEHTLDAYELGIAMGADFIEQDLQVSRDGVLLCLHDATLERTTNVEEVFPERYRLVNGTRRWYAVDFDLREIKRLDAGSWFDPKYAGAKIATFREAIQTVRGRAGLFPELKNPDLYAGKSFSLIDLFLEELEEASLPGNAGAGSTPVLVQSFDSEILRALRERRPELSLTFLLGNTPETRQEWLTAEGLTRISRFADGIGPAKQLIASDPELVTEAHRLGLAVIPYTFRSTELPEGFESVEEEMRRFLHVYAVDGLFTDNPDRFPR